MARQEIPKLYMQIIIICFLAAICVLQVYGNQKAEERLSSIYFGLQAICERETIELRALGEKIDKINKEIETINENIDFITEVYRDKNPTLSIRDRMIKNKANPSLPFGLP